MLCALKHHFNCNNFISLETLYFLNLLACFQGLKSCDSPHFSASVADEVTDAYYATAVMSANKEYLLLDDEV